MTDPGLRERLAGWLEDIWYRRARPPRWLLPAAALYGVLLNLRAGLYRAGILRPARLPVPVVVVGNLTTGGTGKTPLVIALAAWLGKRGWRPGIILRGYRGRSTRWPLAVTPGTDPELAGDEAVLLARETGVPVFAGPDRVQAGRALLATHGEVDILLSDDGLQHLRLARELEILVIDAQRGFGNAHLLPAGPLREPLARARQVDATVSLGASPLARFQLDARPGALRRVADPRQRQSLDAWRGRRCHLVTGIGNPQRLLASVEAAGLQPVLHAYPDHHAFRPQDLAFEDGLPVLMTAKDALKCASFAAGDIWYVEQRLDPGPAFEHWLDGALPAPRGRAME